MNRDSILKVLNYRIEKAVSLYLKKKSQYDDIEKECSDIYDLIRNIPLNDRNSINVINKVEYIKHLLYRIDELNEEKERIGQELDKLKEDIKRLNGEKTALEILMKKYKLSKEKEEEKNELWIAEEVYLNKLANSK